MQSHCYERQLLLTNTSLVHVKIALIAHFIKRLNRKWLQNNNLWDMHFISKAAEGPGAMQSLCLSPLLPSNYPPPCHIPDSLLSLL